MQSIFLCCCFLAGAAFGSTDGQHGMPSGVKAGLYSEVVGQSGFQMNLRPPSETTHDVEASLRALLMLERSKSKAAEAEAVASKQRMLNVEKAKLRHIVKTAFA